MIKDKKNVAILKHLENTSYKAVVRSRLDYCGIVYHVPSHLS